MSIRQWLQEGRGGGFYRGVSRSSAFWKEAWILLLWLGSTGVLANTPAPSTTWLCWDGGATELFCRVLDVDEVSDMGDQTVRPQRAGRVPVGTRALPPLVEAIRLRPESLLGRRISIPMFTDSDDPEFARELAQAVMCGANPGCQVQFIGSVPDIALFMDELGDPALGPN